uniref:unspecific monooxygenase n=1 Tax=Streltzoviella insularis TaxID=1206366 RepID=A0A7D5UMS7_9NEOP|nr:cytochrome P450 28 [Streltzoviella insularis]
MMLVAVVTVFMCILTLVYFLVTKKKNYWKKKGLPHLKPSLILGNYGDFILLKKNLGLVIDDICKQFPDAPLVGAFYGTEPALIVKDPEYIKLVTTKDFYYFSGRELSEHTHKELFFKNVFAESGDYWKVVRQNLTPLFSSAKMKKMFYLIEDCTKVFDRLLDEEIQANDIQEVRYFMARFTLDCIGSCVFGLNSKVMEDNPNKNPFRMIADKALNFSPDQILKAILRNVWPSIFYILRFKSFPEEVSNFFNDLLVNIFKERNYKSTSRHDFVDLMLNLKENDCIIGDGLKNLKTDLENKERVSLKVDDELLVAQSIVFFLAGFETSALTSSFALYELAKNEDAQRRVLEEVDDYIRRHDGQLGYECVTELPYLNACLDETLRLYPVLTFLTREVVEDYTLPTGLMLEKGLRVHLPVYYMHRNPDYFPEPDQFRPERFLGEEKENIKPYTYFPFGEGPRICIGMRFAKMQTMAGLITVLKKYRVELAKGMPRTVEFEPKTFVTISTSGINLKFISRRVVSNRG